MKRSRAMIKLELSIEETNVILSALSELPYKISKSVIEKIHGQAVPQTMPKPGETVDTLPDKE